MAKRKSSAEERTLVMFQPETPEKPAYAKVEAPQLIVHESKYLGDFSCRMVDGAVALRRLTSKHSWVESRLAAAELREAMRLLDDR